MQKTHLLTVAYKIDQYKKREESIKISFMWVPIFPSRPYNVEDNGVLHGQPFKIYVTKETKKIYLYLGQREINNKGEVNDIVPPKLLKAFVVEKKNPLKTELVIQFFQNNDGAIDVKVVNDDVNIIVLGNKTKDGITPPELPSELPQIPIPRFEPMDFLWVIDGTLAGSSFQKCINTAILLSDTIRQKTILEAGYYCFGEYQELFTFEHYPISQNAFTLLKCDLTEKIDEFKASLRSLNPMPMIPHDDPASCLELAFRELANALENRSNPTNKPIWIFVMGNSLPHYTIEELYQRKIHVIPTEEFENIYWKNELERLQRLKNVHIQPIWIDDQNTEKKWAEVDSLGRKTGLHETKSWWKNNLGKSSRCLEMTDDVNASEMSSILYDLIWQCHPPKMATKEPSPYPLWSPLDELKIYVD